MDVVITGLGAISPHGRGVAVLWNGLIEGRSALAPLTLFDASMFRSPLAGVVAGYPDHHDRAANAAGPATRAAAMLQDAADEALCDAFGISDAGLIKTNAALRRAALITGTNFGGMSAAETALVAGRDDSSKAALSDYLVGSASAMLAQRYEIGGPQMNLSLSCASGTAAIGLALDMIRQGRAEIAVACGYDELSLYVYAGLSALRAITPDTIRPFDKRRKGTLFSEGAGVVVLESAEHARRRNAPRIHARILGRAMNNDAYHMTAPEQEARGIQALMRAALKDAAIARDDVAHINLHATGTPYNDAIETKAVHAVFGVRGAEIPVCSVKSSIGHCMGAAGIIESIAAVKTLSENCIPPILGLEAEHKDPECGLNTPLGGPLHGDFPVILKTSYGFGGTNAAIVLSRA